MLLEVFLSYVFDSRELEAAYKQDVDATNILRQMLEEKFSNVNNELIEKMWSKIDLPEFKDKVLTKNYTLYSIDNWVRSKETI